MRPVNAKLGFLAAKKLTKMGFFSALLSWLWHLKTVKNTGDLLRHKKIRLEASNTINSNLNEIFHMPNMFAMFFSYWLGAAKIVVYSGFHKRFTKGPLLKLCWQHKFPTVEGHASCYRRDIAENSSLLGFQRLSGDFTFNERVTVLYNFAPPFLQGEKVLVYLCAGYAASMVGKTSAESRCKLTTEAMKGRREKGDFFGVTSFLI